MKKDDRRGTVIIEASISLMIFMLSIYAILSVIRIAYTQERVAIAADISAKEISEYSHILYATKFTNEFKGKDGYTSEVANTLSNDKVVDGLKKISELLKGDSTTLGKISGQAADLLGSLKNDSGSGYLYNAAGDALATQLIKLNLKTAMMDANTFMETYHIKNLDTSGSDIFFDGKESGLTGGVAIVARYTIELPIFKFFNLEIKKGIDCAHFSYTEIWGGR